MFEAVVREAHHRRAGEPGAVPRTGVRKPVRQDQVVFADERRDHAEIRQIAAAEDQGSLGPFELGELLFEHGIRRVAAGHESRAASPGAVALERFARRRDHSRMVRQPEVVVATERDILLAITAHARAAKSLGFLHRPGQRLPRGQLELRAGDVDERWHGLTSFREMRLFAPVPWQCRGEKDGFQPRNARRPRATPALPPRLDARRSARALPAAVQRPDFPGPDGTPRAFQRQRGPDLDVIVDQDRRLSGGLRLLSAERTFRHGPQVSRD